MNKIYRLLGLMALFLFAMPVSALTPEQIMQKVSAKLAGTSGVSGRFSLKTQGGTVSGNFKFDGRRSFMQLPGSGTSWFDGRNLWSLNPRSKEVTVVVPEASELYEANPLLYLKNYKSQFSVSFSKRKAAGQYILFLTPRTKNLGVRSVEVTVSAKNYMPERLYIIDSQNQPTTMTLSQVELNKKFAPSEFTFPKAKYKGYEVVDLR